MKKSILFLVVCLICNACTFKSKHMNVEHKSDVLDLIYSVADEYHMQVMCDIDLRGGDLWKKGTVDSLCRKSNTYIEKYYNKYGHHSSFWGWYLNNEINPIENSDKEQTLFWRSIWKSIVDKCHDVDPQSKVTISPFFLLDKDGLRGFKYLEPIEYEKWWYGTLKETGIDILMLQDSGAEHLSFFTLEDRRPFFQAFANACKKAGKEFWINVETGEVDAKDWTHALAMEQQHSKQWKFTEMEWLKQKMELATEYATEIINWGYYPLMSPVAEDSGFSLLDIDGQKVDLSSRENNYKSYQNYYKSISDSLFTSQITLPIISGTLWFLPSNMNIEETEELEKRIRTEIQNQKNIGFKYLWICNTPDHFIID